MNSYSECREIVELDLDPIKVKLMHKESGEGWTLEQANIVEAEYRRYLYLMKAFPAESFAPGTDVDTFWHYHILDTTKYAVDCERVFGYFVHHFPYIGLRGEEDMAVHQRLGERMRSIYEAAFGETFPPGRLVSAPRTGAFAAKAGDMAFSASPVGMRAAAGGGIAFSASPVGHRPAASDGVAFSASPVGSRAMTSDGIAFSASPVGSRAAADSGIAFSASPVGSRAMANDGIAFSASHVDGRAVVSKDTAFSASPGSATAGKASPAALSGGPVYMSRLGPQVLPEGESDSPDRQESADEEWVASDDLFSIRPRLPEPVAA